MEKGIKTSRRIDNRKRSRAIFYIAIMAIPVIQFVIFYVVVNFNSIILAFQKYTPREETFGYDLNFVGFENIKWALERLDKSFFMVKNSLIMSLFSFVVGFVLAIMFSFYIYKKKFASGFYRVMLFMPQIVSGMIFAVLYKYMVTDVYCEIVRVLFNVEAQGLLDNAATQFGTVLFFNIWISFGVNVLMYSGSMSTIDTSIVESAQLDGVNVVQEFIHITLALIYPTIVSFVIIYLTGVFTNQFGLYDMFGTDAKGLDTLGYYIFKMAKSSSLIKDDLPSGMPTYGELSALGLVLSAIIVPLILITRKLMLKFGPSDN